MDTSLFVRNQPGGMFSVVDRTLHPSGTVFFVHSGTGTDGAGYGRNPDLPVATLDYALGLCTASAMDTVYLMPGHAETIASATAFVLDKIGVSVIGLGAGALRPTFTFTNTASIVSVTVADCLLENVLIVGNVDNIVKGISLGALADGFTLRNVEMRDGAADKEFLIGIYITAACADVTIDGFKFCGLAGGMSDCIIAAGAADRLKIVNSYIRCDASSHIVDLTAAASTDIFLANNVFIQIDTTAGLGFAAHNSTTGYLIHNNVHNIRDTVAGFSGTGLAYSQCMASNAFNVQGILVPGADS